MSVNKNQPHIYVLPEDKADRELATGFHMEVDQKRYRQMQVLPEMGGWLKVLDCFQSDHIKDMKRYPKRYMVLLIDFDEREDRLDGAKQAIPDDLKDRVFVLGARKDPEGLRSAGLGSPETIGKALAKDCREETDKTWGHDLLRHNASELDRLREHVRPILFQLIS
ncbi:MAG: hypothetical protein ACREA2_21000 [Blastocatellia bacterium]